MTSSVLRRSEQLRGVREKALGHPDRYLRIAVIDIELALPRPVLHHVSAGVKVGSESLGEGVDPRTLPGVGKLPSDRSTVTSNC